MTAVGGGHWTEIARRWGHVGPPLRPGAADLAFYAEVVSGRTAPRALLLGVTPELYRLPWPDGADVIAVDHTPAMIDALWPGPAAAVVCADWTDMELEPGSRDVVLGDGVFHLLDHPGGQARLVDNLARVVRPGGVVGLRLFVPPGAADREAPASVLADLSAGRVANLNLLKLRLGMALQPDPCAGVALGAVYAALDEAEPDLAALAARLGWDLDHLLAIESYRGSDSHYSFVTVDEVGELFVRRGFELEAVHVPSYELGERCPTVVFRHPAP
ncbi:MAG: hypothetical protein QOH36_1758 [Actinomycetota bacterium]|nr:hypothetical protein [Actinomycetota bacterium]